MTDIGTLWDQSGAGRNFTATSPSTPTLATAGANSRACADFDGVDDYMDTATALSEFITAGAAYIIISVIVDTVTLNDADAQDNHALIGDAGKKLGIYAAAAAVATSPLDGLSNYTLAVSASRNLVSTFVGSKYVLVGSDVDVATDQSSSAHNLTASFAVNRPTISAQGPNSIDCFSFDGGQQYLAHSGALMSALITASAGYVIASVIIDAINSNDPTVYNNDGIWTDSTNFVSVVLKSDNTLHGYNWDGNADSTSHSISTGTAYVVEWKHESGTLSTRINKGTWQTAVSGSTSSLSGVFRIGAETSGIGPNFLDGHIAEVVTFNVVPTTGQQDALCDDLMAHIGAV